MSAALSTALALILCVETKNMDCAAIGDTHLPADRQAHGRMQMRKPVLDDLSAHVGKGRFIYTEEDACNPELDISMAREWLIMQCGLHASVSTYLRIYNGGHTGRNSTQAKAYYARAIATRKARPEHFAKCQAEVTRRLQ